ncbi:MAG: hypothetical protein ACRYFX_04805 [Janthinobacterium lividum]
MTSGWLLYLVAATCAKLIQSQRNLASSGLFDPTKIGVTPQPEPTMGLVNVEYAVVEK